MNNSMNDTGFGKAALKKFGAIPEGFQICTAQWMERNPENWATMRVTGAKFAGERKVAGTSMTTIVTKAEIDAEREAIAQMASADAQA